MPTFGWPEGTTVDPAKLPDWSWRSKPTLDVRKESERPPPGQLRALDPTETRVQSILANHAEPGKELTAYATIAARHHGSVRQAAPLAPDSVPLELRARALRARAGSDRGARGLHRAPRSQRGAWYAADRCCRISCSALRSTATPKKCVPNWRRCNRLRSDYVASWPTTPKRRKTRRSCRRSAASSSTFADWLGQEASPTARSSTTWGSMQRKPRSFRRSR